jgi:hypothetical protein
MVIGMSKIKWRKRLLDSRKSGVLYTLPGLDQFGVLAIYFIYENGKWCFIPDYSKEAAEFEDVDEATDYLLALNVNEFEKEEENAGKVLVFS